MADLAHQSTPRPTANTQAANKAYADSVGGGASSDIYFSWNHTDILQFAQSDPTGAGFGMSFVAATATTAEHIRITAPVGWAGTIGPFFVLLAADISVANYEVVVTHGFFNPATLTSQVVGPCLRQVDSNDYLATLWTHTNVTTMRTVSQESGILGGSVTNEELLPLVTSSTVVRTVGYCHGRLYGGGWGRVANLGNIPSTAAGAAITDRTPGFIVESMTSGAGTALTLNIYDFIVKKAGS